MRARALLAVAAMTTGLAATALPASAQTYVTPGQPVNSDAYCAQVRQNRMLTGGALGAAAGVLLGNNLGRGSHRSDGRILGGVVGAASGAMIGRNTGECSVANQNRARAAQNGYGYPQQGYPQQGYPQQAYPQPGGYERYPLEGGPTYNNTGYGSQGGDPNCRWGTVSTRDPDGREVRDSIYMCRGRDGVWRAQQPY